MRILITGFEPFGESPLNPSQEIVNSLPEVMFESVDITKAILPVEQAAAPPALIGQIRKIHPDAVVCFGLALGRAVISIERIAVNLMDFRIPDNSGIKVTDQPVVDGGPTAYFSTLPVRQIHSALVAQGLPAELSLNAGAYLCNQVFYRMMHEIASHHLLIRAGFIHLPALPEQVAELSKPVPSMSLDLEKTAVNLIITQLFSTNKGETIISE